MSENTDAASIAKMMQRSLESDNYLHQDVAVGEVMESFGDEYIYYNDNGNAALSKIVLDEFRKLNDQSVVWSRSQRAWRFRDDDDLPGRSQP